MLARDFLDRLNAVDNALRALNLAKRRAQSTDVLLDLLDYKERTSEMDSAIFALSERSLTEVETAQIEKIANDGLAFAEQCKWKQKSAIERNVYFLSDALRGESRWRVAQRCLQSKRKGRRNIGFRILKGLSVKATSQEYFIQRFEETQDIRFAKYALNFPLAADNPAVQMMLDLIDEEYWKMRVMEAAIRSDFERSKSLASIDPILYIWGCGRVGNSDTVDFIDELFWKSNNRALLLSIVTWAYGKLGALNKLIALEPEIGEQKLMLDKEWEQFR